MEACWFVRSVGSLRLMKSSQDKKMKLHQNIASETDVDRDGMLPAPRGFLMSPARPALAILNL